MIPLIVAGWVLIIPALSTNAQAVAIYFSTGQACEAARKQIGDMKGVKPFCAPTGAADVVAAKP